MQHTSENSGDNKDKGEETKCYKELNNLLEGVDDDDVFVTRLKEVLSDRSLKDLKIDDFKELYFREDAASEMSPFLLMLKNYEKPSTFLRCFGSTSNKPDSEKTLSVVGSVFNWLTKNPNT